MRGTAASSFREAQPERTPGGWRVDREGLRSVWIRPARLDDVPAIARLHMELLPQAFLPLLGHRFLLALFRAQVLEPDAVPFVAERDAEVIGYASGFLSMPSFRRRLVRRHVIALIRALLPHLLHPARLRRILQTATYPERTAGLPEAEFAFVGVKRRTAPGLGTELGNAVLWALAERGAREVKGYVASDNRPMNSMVQRMGFELRARISLHDGRPSNVYVIRLDATDPTP